MRVTVVSDTHGKILSVFGPPELGGKATLTYVPNDGESVHVLDVPESFERRTREDMHIYLRVETKGDTVSLITK
jgi:hypothetical protein